MLLVWPFDGLFIWWKERNPDWTAEIAASYWHKRARSGCGTRIPCPEQTRRRHQEATRSYEMAQEAWDSIVRGPEVEPSFVSQPRLRAYGSFW